MNLRQALLHNTGWKVLAMLFTFVNNILIVHLLDADAGAGFFYLLTIFVLLSTVLRFGMENGIVYYLSKFPDRLMPLTRFLGIATLCQLIISYLVIRFLIREAGPYSIFWSMIYVTGNVSIYYLTAFFQVKKMYMSINVFAVVITLLQTILLAYIYFFDDHFLIGNGMANHINGEILLIMSAAILIQVIGLLIYFFQRVEADKLPAASLPVRQLFNYSMINFCATTLLFLVMRADFYFVQQYCDPVTLANYVQVAKIGQMALLLPSMLGGVIFPYAVNADESFVKKIGFFCRSLSLLFLAGFIGLLLFGKFIFIHLLGVRYNLVYSGILAAFPGVYCLALGIVFTSYFEGKNRQRIVLASALLTLGIILIGDRVFVPKYGYMAAAVIFSVANFGGMLLLAGAFIRKTKMRIKEMFLFKKDDRNLIRNIKS